MIKPANHFFHLSSLITRPIHNSGGKFDLYPNRITEKVLGVKQLVLRASASHRPQKKFFTI